MQNNQYLKNFSYSALLSLDYGMSSGSGFLLQYNKSKYLITAKHVLFNKDGKLRCENLVVTSKNIRGNDDAARILDIEIGKATYFSNPIDDISVILIGRGTSYEDCITVQQEGHLTLPSIDSDMVRGIDAIGITNDIYLIGFPTSLYIENDKDNQYFDVSRPLLRKGIIAGLNEQDNRFIIDCPSYYGDSGGPVLEIGEDQVIRLIGIVSRQIPFFVSWKNNREPGITNTEFSNSGYSVCVAINSILDLIKTNSD